ncbi:MAG: T9SS type A sorting domain-containing protein [Saprospiraceae bacterium]
MWYYNGSLPTPLVGSGGSNGFDQACSDCIPQGLMTVFPNPTSTTVNVKWSSKPSGTIQLTDLLGRLLMEHKLQSRNEFNVSKLGSGIYLVRVKVDGYKQQVERVVVER